MKRRDFLKNGSIAAAGGAVVAGCGSGTESSGGAAAVQTRPRVSWRIASSFPRSLDTIYGAAEVLAARVSELTDGRFTIRALLLFSHLAAKWPVAVLLAVVTLSVVLPKAQAYFLKAMIKHLSFLPWWLVDPLGVAEAAAPQDAVNLSLERLAALEAKIDGLEELLHSVHDICRDKQSRHSE